MTNYQFSGGPLDGQMIAVRGVACCYRDADGNPVRTPFGDRALCSGYKRRPKLAGLYACQRGVTNRYVWHPVRQSE